MYLKKNSNLRENQEKWYSYRIILSKINQELAKYRTSCTRWALNSYCSFVFKLFTVALQHIARKNRMPDSWKYSPTINALSKGNGDALVCNIHRSFRLLEHGMKITEKVLDSKLLRITNIGSSQLGFQPEKSTEDTIFIVRQLQEKYLQKKIIESLPCLCRSGKGRSRYPGAPLCGLFFAWATGEAGDDDVRIYEIQSRSCRCNVGGLSNRGWCTPGCCSELITFHPGYWRGNIGVRRCVQAVHSCSSTYRSGE